MAAVEVRPVMGRGNRERFIRFPYWLHRNDEHWIPPLLMERRQFLNPKRNPFFKRAEVQLFLAWRDGEPVGRISAQIDPRWDERQGGRDGMFGFFETVDDPEVTRALVDAAADWLRERGRDRMVGPMDFTTNDECGLLVEGYDIDPIILQPWHPPHYREFLEAEGLTKSMDLLMYSLALGGDMYAEGSFHPMIHKIAAEVSTKHGVTVRNMRKRDLTAEVGRFMEVYNAAWDRNWGFVPVDEEEVAFQAKNLKAIVEERWTMIAERDGEILGAALTLPDINRVLKGMGGRLLPLGWLHFLRNKPKIDYVRVFALGVKPEHQHLGIAAAFYVRHLEEASPDGVWGGETGWILETNEAMNRAMEGMGGRVVKRYRLFEKAL